MNTFNLKTGDILSETSHYIVKNISKENIIVKHFESGESIAISNSYINNFTKSADYYNEEVLVTKEDKKDGTLGIRSIFENIYDSKVFTVCFKKQDKPKTKKKLELEINELINKFSQEIDTIKKNKKGVTEASKKFVEELIKTPILPYEEGEDRILRGYKVQFDSRDGKYSCIDMDITEENNQRLVNINTIKWLIVDGIKYTVK